MTPSAYRMIVRSGPNPGTVFELTREVSTIGRDVTNEVVIGDAEISRQHARLTRTPGGYVLEDLGSTNGTFVNSERLMAPRVLNPGDLIALGENVNLMFDAVAPEAAATVASPVGSPATVEPQQAAPPRKAAAPAAPPPAASAPPMGAIPAPPAAETPRKRFGGWKLAAVGCFVLILACIGTLFFMDAFYPDVLYAPLRWFGF
jgi:predicted component of type VI protein secretion system